MSDEQVAKIYRVEVWEQVDSRGVWKPILREITSAYTGLGALKSVLETRTAKTQLELSRTSEPKDGPVTRYLDSGAWLDPE